MERVRAHVLISGRVQGVFFRAWIQSWAQKLGLGGWVKNTEEGEVEAVFVGAKAKVEEVIQECYRGSILTQVEKVKIDWEEVGEELSGFEIK